jgi:predicted Ser/Thr protein kinase
MVPEDLPFQFIRDITDDFAEERILGEGGFGVVYKVRFRHPQFLLTTVICLANKNCVVFQNNMVLLYQRGQKPSNFRMW